MKAVIFDIDNTLYSFDTVNHYGMQAVNAYCASLTGLGEAQLTDYYNKAWRMAARRIGTDTAAIHNRMIRFQCMMELMGQPLFPHVRNLYDLYWNTLLDHMEPSEGIVPFIRALKDLGLRTGIGTDMTAYIQYRKLEALGLAPYIDIIVTSEEAGVEKPHPDFFQLCVEKAGCRPEECAFIGDHLEKDVNGSSACGLCGIWYSQGQLPEKELPFPVIRSFTDALSSVHAVWMN